MLLLGYIGLTGNKQDKRLTRNGTTMKKNKPDLTTIGGRVSNVRNNLNITQETLAEALCTDPTTISRIENNHRTPDAIFLKDICEKLYISADYILWGKEIPFFQPFILTPEEEKAICSLYQKIQLAKSSSELDA